MPDMPPTPEDPTRPAPPRPAPERPAPAGRVVLVVEDDPEINHLVGAYAGLAGFSYRAAMTAAAAFDEIRRHRPALIVLDVMLPDLDGFEICRRVKEDPDTRPIPVILLTALGEAYRQRGLACGASDYLGKPFDPDLLMEAMNRYATGS